ncbi:DUF2971 domain-containing protein [Mesorhizobium sp.]|uniref:DUF2971 domain-containing protein n=1 Tax=Mesorhizobium sp. TaxID=1871066 RepID=UPI000FE4BD46|nr:DUF2971 domain-containing protein [Mesorhizobium sp.]RWK44843.1 MAG: DUF2971 domain-containing protein [Mesorhizobium sp.]TIP39008.1 MAG: DUF2971 domain-containing protein [Mesorhizobium sp.]TIQ13000.1 MAG: DUF2971 domain-containing protein [Mesorhizobium sp.]
MPIQPHPNLPGSLYKYASPDAALAILENGTLQFGRPSTFDDEFDMRLNLAMNIDEETVIVGALDQIWESAYGPVPIPAGNKFGRALLALRFLFPHPPERAEFDAFMRPQLADRVRQWNADLKRFCDLIAGVCSNHKVLCLSASATIAPMWGLYAGNHEGAVLQYAPTSDDSFFLLARPVAYVAEVPVLFDNEGFIDWLSGRRALDEEESLHDLFVYTKTQAWATQEEWRIVAGDGWQPDAAREFVPFAAADLHSVIFGSRARMSCEMQSRRWLVSGIRHAAFVNSSDPR